MSKFSRDELVALAQGRDEARTELMTGESSRFSNASTLHKDDFEKIIGDVIYVRQHSSTGIEDIRSAGLIEQAEIEQILVGYENTNEFTAEISLHGSNQTQDQTDYEPKFVPQPIIEQHWKIPFRQGGFSYKSADGGRNSAVAAAELREQTLFLGAPRIVVSGNSLYGYLNDPKTVPYPSFSDWYANPDNVYNEWIDALAKLNDSSNGFGDNQIMAYVNTALYKVLRKDKSSQKGDNSVLAAIESLPEMIGVKSSRWLPNEAGKVAVLFVKMTKDSVQYHESMDLTQVAHPRLRANEAQKFTTMAVGALQIIEDRNGKVGVLFGTTP